MSETFDFDVVIVGGGPAGLSAALVLGRACRTVLVCDGGEPRNGPSMAVHGFLTRDGTPPAELRRLAREQLAPYEVRFREGDVSAVRRVRRGFAVTHADGSSQTCRRVLLATGMRDHLPEMAGFGEIYGLSAHHCPYCDGWEWRGRAVAVYAPDGGAEYAIGMTSWTGDVVLLTDGARLSRGDAAKLKRNGVVVEDRRVKSLQSERGMLRSIEFRSGAPIERETLFFHLGMEQASGLPRRMGCRMDSDGFVVVNDSCRTSLDGVYAAGDATPGPQSVALAAAEGSIAAAAIHQDMRKEDTA